MSITEKLHNFFERVRPRNKRAEVLANLKNGQASADITVAVDNPSDQVALELVKFAREMVVGKPKQ